MDEMISYVSTYRGRGYGNKLYNFLDCLGEVARGEPNVVLVVSIPASDLEYTAEDTADEARFKKMLDRIGKAIVMSADQEMAEIIRRRLFEWNGLPRTARKLCVPTQIGQSNTPRNSRVLIAIQPMNGSRPAIRSIRR